MCDYRLGSLSARLQKSFAIATLHVPLLLQIENRGLTFTKHTLELGFS